MGLVFCNYAFKGPYYDTDDVADLPGVYVILSSYGSRYKMLDAGHAPRLKSGIDEHCNRELWAKHNKGVVMCAVFYAHNLPHGLKEEMVSQIREKYRPVVGSGQ